MRANLRQGADLRLRVLLRLARGRLRLRGNREDADPGNDRLPSPLDLALPGAPPHRRGPDGGPLLRLHPPRGRAQPGPGARPERGLRQGRRQLPSHPLVQGPRRRRRPHEGEGVRVRYGRLRLDGEPRQLGRRPGRPSRTQAGRLHPRGSRDGEGHRLPHLRSPGRGRGGELRPGQPPLQRDRIEVQLGVRQHQPAPVLRRGIEDHRLRSGRTARLADPGSYRRPRGVRLPLDEGMEGLHRVRQTGAHLGGARKGPPRPGRGVLADRPGVEERARRHQARHSEDDRQEPRHRESRRRILRDRHAEGVGRRRGSRDG